jgi:hypothetical protein
MRGWCSWRRRRSQVSRRITLSWGRIMRERTEYRWGYRPMRHMKMKELIRPGPIHRVRRRRGPGISRPLFRRLPIVLLHRVLRGWLCLIDHLVFPPCMKTAPARLSVRFQRAVCLGEKSAACRRTSPVRWRAMIWIVQQDRRLLTVHCRVHMTPRSGLRSIALSWGRRRGNRWDGGSTGLGP